MVKKILIFDDNKDILELCTLILEGAGYHTKASSTADNIISRVAEYEPNLILMDNWLPDIGGIAATQELKKHPVYKHIPVIYFSANNDIKALAATAGAESYLSKPFDIDELEEMVASVIRQQE